MKRLWIVMGVIGCLVVLSVGRAPVAAQGAGGACGVIVETAVSMAGQLCGDIGRNTACYGHALLQAEARPGVEGFVFSRLGDQTGLDTVGRLRLSALDETTGQWGVALLRVQANLPETLPGQNVTMVLFGQAELAPQAGDDSTGGQAVAVIASAGTVVIDQPSLAGGPLYGPVSADTPFIAEGITADGYWLRVRLPEGGAGWVMIMQATGDISGLPVVDDSGQVVGGPGASGTVSAYYFASGMNDAPCALAPASGLLLQSPTDAGEVRLHLDGVDIALASTAYIQAAPGGEFVLSLLEGQATVSAAGVSQIVPAGWRIHVPLDAQGAASGAPFGLEPYDLAALNALPLVLLPTPVTIAPPGSGLAGDDHAMGDGLREDQESTEGGTTGEGTTGGGSGGPNLIFNGDFELGFAGWEMVQECETCGMQTNSDPNARINTYLAWQRIDSGGSGGAIWARQPLNIDMRQCTDLHFGFDVRVDDQSLTNSGWYSDEHGGNGEYPVLVRLAFMPAFQGSQFDWAQGFLTLHDGTTTLRNYTVVPAGEWVRFEVDVQSPTSWVDGFGMALTNPGILTDVYVGGSGWDFTGAIDNLFLTGTDCPRALP